MSEKPRILCVDDEENILKAVQRSLRKKFDIVTATSGQQGLDILSEDSSFQVVISDMKMPEMNGATFLRIVREKYPDIVRLLLTGFADLDTVVTAVNEGYIYRFIAKPCSAAVLMEAINDGIKQHNLLVSESVLLEQTLKGSIHALTEVLSMASPASFGRGSRISKLATSIANHLDVPDLWQVEVAAMLSQIGCITLPHGTAMRLHLGEKLNAQEEAMVARMPQMTCQVLESIPRLEPVLDILTYQSYNYDGDGAAEGSPVGEELPFGARILKVAVQCEKLHAQGLTPGNILDDLRAFSSMYDPDIIDAYDTIVETVGIRETNRGITLAELRTGMVFTKDVTSASGVLLVASGQECTVSLLERIKNYEQTVGLTQPMWVMNTDEESEDPVAEALFGEAPVQNTEGENVQPPVTS